MVERDFEMVSDEQAEEMVALSRNSMREHFPELDWEGTHVCHTDEHEIKAFCVYSAPNMDRLYEHVGSSGRGHRIYEIVGDINPSDVAL